MDFKNRLYSITKGNLQQQTFSCFRGVLLTYGVIFTISLSISNALYLIHRWLYFAFFYSFSFPFKACFVFKQHSQIEFVLVIRTLKNAFCSTCQLSPVVMLGQRCFRIYYWLSHLQQAAMQP